VVIDKKANSGLVLARWRNFWRGVERERGPEILRDLIDCLLACIVAFFVLLFFSLFRATTTSVFFWERGVV